MRRRYISDDETLDARRAIAREAERVIHQTYTLKEWAHVPQKEQKEDVLKTFGWRVPNKLTITVTENEVKVVPETMQDISINRETMKNFCRLMLRDEEKEEKK